MVTEVGLYPKARFLLGYKTRFLQADYESRLVEVGGDNASGIGEDLISV